MGGKVPTRVMDLIDAKHSDLQRQAGGGVQVLKAPLIAATLLRGLEHVTLDDVLSVGREYGREER
jgi:hypothetical protein